MTVALAEFLLLRNYEDSFFPRFSYRKLKQPSGIEDTLILWLMFENLESRFHVAIRKLCVLNFSMEFPVEICRFEAFLSKFEKSF